jgi:tellurite methyltransferase
MIPSEDVRRQFGDIDIYLFDQLQRGRFDNRRQVLDAGCGAGRNLVYLLRAGFTIFGVDRDPGAIAAARSLAAELAPALPAENFRSGELDALPWPDLEVDAVICSAVLHFARDTQHFDAILSELWRVLAPGGLFFARLASVIGLEVPVNVGQDGRTRLPDGSDRFVVTEAMLHERSRRFGASQLDPLKTTNVQNQRCMTTWVLMKPA